MGIHKEVPMEDTGHPDRLKNTGVQIQSMLVLENTGVQIFMSTGGVLIIDTPVLSIPKILGYLY